MKKEITQLPFQIFYEQRDYKTFARYATWLLPQALAYVGNYRINRNAEGKYDGLEFAKSFVSGCSLGPHWAKGLLFYLISSPRGLIFPTGHKSTAIDLLPYSALVPLILAAFKKYQFIKYSEWTNISSIVDEDLYKAMTCSVPDIDDLLQLRVEGTTIKSGDKAGTVKNPTSATTLTKTGHDEFDALPRLAKIMLTQCWVAHPAYRHEYMVLDPRDWDKMPASLIDTDLGLKVETKVEWDT